MKRKECSAALLTLLMGSLVQAGAAGPAPLEAGVPKQAPQLALAHYLASADQSEGWSAAVIEIEASIHSGASLGRLRAIRRVLPSGGNEYEVLEMEGDHTVRQQVIARYLSAEKEASQTRAAGIAVTPANYRFRYRRAALTEGRRAWVFDIIPRKKRAGLMRGELRIDAASGMVMRQAGRLVQTPSVFLRHVTVARDTEIHDAAPCVRVTHMVMDAAFLGRVELTITERPFTSAATTQSLAAGTSTESEAARRGGE